MNNMAPVAGWKIVGNSSENPSHDLMWTLQPIFRTLQIFGIELELNQPHSICHRRVSLALKMSIFALVGSVAGIILINLDEIILNAGNRKRHTALTLCSNLIITTSFTVAILAAAHWKWGTLWKKLQKVAQFTQFTANIPKKIRLVTMASIIGFIIFVRINTVHLKIQF